MYLLDKECSSAVLNQFTKITEKIKRRLNIFVRHHCGLDILMNDGVRFRQQCCYCCWKKNSHRPPLPWSTSCFPCPGPVRNAYLKPFSVWLCFHSRARLGSKWPHQPRLEGDHKWQIVEGFSARKNRWFWRHLHMSTSRPFEGWKRIENLMVIFRYINYMHTSCQK